MNNSSTDNIYCLDGKIPVKQAIPFGLQHILAMFVANIAPIFIVAGACGLSSRTNVLCLFKVLCLLQVLVL